MVWENWPISAYSLTGRSSTSTAPSWVNSGTMFVVVQNNSRSVPRRKISIMLVKLVTMMLRVLDDSAGNSRNQYLTAWEKSLAWRGDLGLPSPSRMQRQQWDARCHASETTSSGVDGAVTITS